MSDVTLESLTKAYGDEVAVDGIDLTIRDGEILGVVGPSGCGKTTTLRTIAGFETPTQGRVLFDGVDVTHVPPEERNVGLVFQSYALFDTMTVRENVAFGPKMQGVPKAERRERADELLAMLDIAELADRRPTTLSGGQQQRVGLARALAIEPHVLLLDEPMTGLDAELKTRLRDEIGDLLADLEVTALYVTHDQEEAMAMCDRIAVLADGTLEQVGPPAEIYRRPENPFVANFVGSSTLLEGVAENGHVDLGFTELPVAAETNGSVRVAARPAAFELGEGSLEADLTDVTYLGDRTRLTATLPDDTTVTLHAHGIDGYRVGDSVGLSIDEQRVHVLE
ncbi:ABC transporter-related protein [Natrinema pellirubrum DSM 15624]|uniref:Molybdate/tungstate import ATP-binding protein WtpC n=1 Tax=Natrinema pellirubrum (strain DSM 15624 / CIP 106293 / JCM 10476 / NCIMB 786 / 157) TaxID=797303 RepID=L0JG90_NATP1|nr:ABC transporter ATP-binding protein [Natrinema pellirubrum]AGB30299.1 ABC-type spermidine/putrescine transport system, ATPase component [Natrinema pellirubrum DSM 15624]ELY79029.1 ABC transporter-related protein [Natrinema pellirubrum DSM 15624]